MSREFVRRKTSQLERYCEGRSQVVRILPCLVFEPLSRDLLTFPSPAASKPFLRLWKQSSPSCLCLLVLERLTVMEATHQWPTGTRNHFRECWSTGIHSSQCHKLPPGRLPFPSPTATSTIISELGDRPRWSNSSTSHQVAKQVLTTTVTLTSLSYTEYVTFTSMSIETDHQQAAFQRPILSQQPRQLMKVTTVYPRSIPHLLSMLHRLFLLLISKNLPKAMPRCRCHRRQRQIHRHQVRVRKKRYLSHLRLVHRHLRY